MIVYNYIIQTNLLYITESNRELPKNTQKC